ncbi:MAG: tape measure protein [Rhodobacteraceae bacterium]|nr:tape measure protein [Paracoccaceae bacterium]
MANQKLNTTITIGAALSGSVRNAIGGLTGALGRVGDEIGGIVRKQRELDRQRATYAKQGKAVDDLDREYQQLGATLDQLRQKQERLQNVQAGIGQVGSALANTRDQLVRTGAALAATATAAGYGFKRYFVDVAAEFERFETILTTTEGSSEKARESMDWISGFASKTPYDLATVTEAFVKMRAYGLDPTNGLLQTLGDTSAAMGKDVIQAVEAMADAVNGENERLKEFGIKAAKEGNQIVYTYTNAAGKQMRAVVDANNREMITSTLQAIFNEKYAGAMDKLSTTWGGMLSNVGDQWTRFANMVMEAGVFDFLKNQLGDALNQLNAWAADGTMKAWAESTGAAILDFGRGVVDVGKAVAAGLVVVKDFIGGWQNLGIAVAALSFAPLIVSVGQLGVAMVGLVAATGPVGLVVAGIAAAAVLIVTHWDEIKGGAIAAFDALKGAADAAVGWVVQKFRELAAKVNAILAPIRDALTWVGDSVNSVGSAASSWWNGEGQPEGHRGVARHAKGGPMMPGAALVGELGPELVFPSRQAYVATARQTEDLASGRGGLSIGGITINAPAGMDPRAIADAVIARIEAMQRRAMFDTGL